MLELAHHLPELRIENHKDQAVLSFGPPWRTVGGTSRGPGKIGATKESRLCPRSWRQESEADQTISNFLGQQFKSTPNSA